MKKAVLLMIAFAFLISAAFLMSGKDAGAASFDDYNKYVYRHGMAAHFGNRCAFWDGESYTAISYEAGKAAFASPVPLECENGIYGSDNSLYYIKAGSGVPAIYKTAGGREIEVSDLDFLAGSDIGYACRIGGGYAVLEVLYSGAETPRSAIIALDLESKEAEERVLFDSASGAPLMYGGAEIRDEWLFVQASGGASKARALYACSLASAETRLICEEWSKESVIALKDAAVCWYDPQAGSFRPRSISRILRRSKSSLPVSITDSPCVTAAAFTLPTAFPESIPGWLRGTGPGAYTYWIIPGTNSRTLRWMTPECAPLTLWRTKTPSISETRTQI